MGRIGRGQNKLLLFGEHAVVQGYPALGLSLPWSVSLEDLGASDRWIVEGLEERFQPGVVQVFELLSRQLEKPQPRRYLLRYSISPESGLGSSAAFCAAAVRVLLPHIDMDGQGVLAQEAENLFHGKSSGVDTALALRKGLWLFEPKTPSLPELTAVPFPLPALVVGSIPRSSSAKELILNLHARACNQEHLVKEALGFLGGAPKMAITYLEQKKYADFGNLARACQEKLEALELGTPELSMILEAAYAAGALGAKLSGAGAGGAFWIAAPTREVARRIVDTVLDTMKERPGFRWLLPPALL